LSYFTDDLIFTVTLARFGLGSFLRILVTTVTKEDFIMNQAKIPALNMLFVSRDLDYTGNTYPPNQEWVNPNPGQRNVGYSDVWDMPDEEVIKYLTEVEMFGRVRKLEDGSFVGCMKLAYTMSVCTDITPSTPYAYRWCFKDPEEAFYFCLILSFFLCKVL
jgi:hypothetical protein